MSMFVKMKRAVKAVLWEAETEWYEATMAGILFAYCLWTALFGTSIFTEFNYMARLAPPIAWSVWFGAVAAIKITGLVVGSPKIRNWGSWAGTFTWTFLFAQFLYIEPTSRLGLPTFAVLALTNAWLVIKTSLLLERERRSKWNKPSQT